MSTLRISFFVILSICLTTLLPSQSITNTLGGNTDAEVFDVEDSDNNTLLRIQGDGGALFLGTFGTGKIPAEGVGTRMMWYPKKAAFRVGRIINTYWDSTVWDDENIGEHSVAMGYNTKASAASSTAIGTLTQATGYRSFATGLMTIASGEQSTAMGWETEANADNSIATGRETKAVGQNTFAMGYKTRAYGEGSVAMGNITDATGEWSTAMGEETSSEALYSVATGYRTRAYGDAATTMGSETYAGGKNSVAMGLGTSAGHFAEVAIGRYNTRPTGNPDLWEENDRVFVIGNGSTVFAPSDALVVLKNGNTGIGTSTPDATFQVDGTVKMLGAWSSDGDFTTETVYQSATDGFVLASLTNWPAGVPSQIVGFTDSSNPPTERIISQIVAPQTISYSTVSIMFPVRKGDYWKVSDMSDGAITGGSNVRWIPLGN